MYIDNGGSRFSKTGKKLDKIVIYENWSYTKMSTFTLGPFQMHPHSPWLLGEKKKLNQTVHRMDSLFALVRLVQNLSLIEIPVSTHRVTFSKIYVGPCKTAMPYIFTSL